MHRAITRILVPATLAVGLLSGCAVQDPAYPPTTGAVLGAPAQPRLWPTVGRHSRPQLSEQRAEAADRSTRSNLARPRPNPIGQQGEAHDLHRTEILAHRGAVETRQWIMWTPTRLAVRGAAALVDIHENGGQAAQKR